MRQVALLIVGVLIILVGDIVPAVAARRGKRISPAMLHGHDLDQEFARFESSQNVDLADVGSFFFVGPLGMVVTKEYDFARLI